MIVKPKHWLLTLIVRVAVTIATGFAAGLWALRCVQVDSSWAHPIGGRILCGFVVLFCLFLGVSGIRHPWNIKP